MSTSAEIMHIDLPEKSGDLGEAVVQGEEHAMNRDSDEYSLKSRKYTTVLQDPSNFDVLHPLQYTWVWTFDRHDQRRKSEGEDNWGANIHPITRVNSVEGFWGSFPKIMDGLKSLQVTYDCHFFKSGIDPFWEDPRNADGGRLMVNIPQQNNGDKTIFEQVCLEILLLMIGETLPYSDEVAGCFISSRRAVERIAVWLCTFDDVVVSSISNFLSESLIKHPIDIKAERHGANNYSSRRGNRR